MRRFSFAEIVLRLLHAQQGKAKAAQPANQAGSAKTSSPADSCGVLGGGQPQPVARDLDQAEDIADVYSRSSRSGLARLSVPGRNPAGQSELIKGSLARVSPNAVQGRKNVRPEEGRYSKRETPSAPESKFSKPWSEFTCTCAISETELCGNEDVVGICRHCNEFVCRIDLKHGYCYYGPRHEVRKGCDA